MIACRCGMVIVKPLGGEITCIRCGLTVDVPADPNRPSDDCDHRGDRIGHADCGCGGSPVIYRCRLHGLAMLHKLKPGKVRATIGGEKQCVEMAYCSVCPDDTRQN